MYWVYEVEGARPRGRPVRTWTEIVQRDCQAHKLNRWASTKWNIHPLTPILIISHPLSASSMASSLNIYTCVTCTSYWIHATSANHFGQAAIYTSTFNMHSNEKCICIFTRDSIYAIARICHGNSVRLSVRVSVCLSVCHTGGSVKKRLKLGSRNFHHTVAPSLWRPKRVKNTKAWSKIR